MPSESPEPENYSISEMMDRLKERSTGQPSNGELVTRADGSQAIRVRSRKRRSHQPQREGEKRKRRIHAAQLVVGLLSLFVIGGILLAIVLYMNGASYRNKVLTNIRSATGAEGAFTQFRVTPLGASAAELRLSWPQSSVLKEAVLQQVSARLRFNSFLGQPWTGDEMTAARGSVQLGLPAGQTAGDAPTHEALFNFSRFRCADTSLIFGSNAQAAAMVVNGTEVSLYPTGKTGQSELRFNKGKVHFGGNVPELDLDRALVGLSGNQTNLIGMRLHGPGDILGAVDLSGPIASINSNQVTTLDMKTTGVSVEHLVGPDLGHLLSGRIDSRDLPNTNFISFSPDSPTSHRMVMAFQGSAGSRLVLSQFPFLTRLSLLLDDKAYKQAVLDAGASGVLRLDKGVTSVDDLKLDVRNRMAVRGNFSIAADKTLTGRIEVGLPALVATNDRRLDAAFGPLKSEMRWIELTVSGTAAAPVDDFDKKVADLDGGAGRQSPRGVAPGGGAADAFRELTQPR